MARARVQGADRDRGSTTIEMVVIFPVLLILLFSAVQTGLWFHNRNIAMTAAQEGARAAAAYDSTTANGRSAAMEFATAAGGYNPTVDISSTGTLITVTVSLADFNLIPGLIPRLNVKQSATMPLERIS